MRPIPESYTEKVAEMLIIPAVYPYWETNKHAVTILHSSPEDKVAYLFLIIGAMREGNLRVQYQERLLSALVCRILQTPLPLSEDDFATLLHDLPHLQLESYAHGWSAALADQVEQFHLQPPLSPSWRGGLSEMRQLLSPDYSPNYGDFGWSPLPRMKKLAELLGGIEEGIGEHGDTWIDAAISDLNALSAEQRTAWLALFAHARNSKEGKPKAKWLTQAGELIERVGRAEFESRLQAWLPLFGKDDGWWFADREEANDASFKGLVWMSSLVQTPAIVRPLGAALRGSVKARGRAGVRSQKVCNALLWVLSSRDEVEAVSALASAKRSVKHGAILKTIEKALSEIATRLGVAPDDLEELATPDFGLKNGILKRDFDSVALEITFSTGKAVWNWTTSEGKPLKNPPASVKTTFAADIKELKAQTSEIEKVLGTIKDRLDLAVREEKTWSLEAWRERYLDHPLASLVAHHVIWEWHTEARGEWSSFLPQLDSPIIPDNAQIRLWHPIFHPGEDVLGWRRRLEDAGIQQPWKQAHREVYRLTDAERATGTYSNRFAAHVLKQHQFNALCGARGWKNSLRLMVDASYPPATKAWLRYNLRAEFWIEGIGEDYGTDTNETGTYWRLSTDQVRFYPLDVPENRAHAGGGAYYTANNYHQTPATALNLADIPSLVFSETMRDIDLFVGVASVGNDPTWEDGGPGGHFRDYWQRFGFGELEESARSRADVLSRLVPRLKIRDRARIEGRFLRVEGTLRAYKIHLGSGNILMDPNDQYLCIVPKSASDTDLLLPFEGDRTLALIISKALLLAEDDKIKDPSILSQIQRK